LTRLSWRCHRTRRNLTKIIDGKFNTGSTSGEDYPLFSDFGEIETVNTIAKLNAPRRLSGLATGRRPYACVSILHYRVTVRTEDSRTVQNHAANPLRCPCICLGRFGLASASFRIKQVFGDYSLRADYRLCGGLWF
jgi:hypothetical protein